MIETNMLGSAVGIEYDSRQNKESLSLSKKGVIVGRFLRGRTDKPFTVTKDSYKALLGVDPLNPSYTVVDDLFIAGAESVMVMRIGKPFLDIAKINTAATIRIYGLATVGEQLSCIVYDANGISGAIKYEWLAEGEIVGTSSTYTLKPTDKGKRVLVRATFLDSDRFREVVTSDLTVPVLAIEYLSKVTISGIARVGDILTSDINDPNGVPDEVNYQWIIDNMVAGSTKSYQIKQSDKGKTIFLRVSYVDNDGFNEIATSAETAPVIARNNRAYLSIAGNHVVGQTLSAIIEDDNGVASEIIYQWLVDGVIVSMSDQLVLIESYKYKKIILKVNYIDGDGYHEALTSANNLPVSPLNYQPIVTVTGTTKVGETLTGSVSDPNGISSSISYQWLADGVVVGTSRIYTLTNNDKRKVIKLRASYTDNDGFIETITSQGTAPITPINYLAKLTIYGVEKVGELFYCNISDLNGVPDTVSYEWFANDVLVGTSSEYRTTVNDKSKKLWAKMSFIDKDGFSETVTSQKTGLIQPVNNKGSVLINGVSEVNSLLTSTIKDANGIPVDVSYYWFVENDLVSVSSSYTVVAADINKRITLRVSYTDNDGFNEYIFSQSTAPVVALNTASIVYIRGFVKGGSILTGEIIDENGVPTSNIDYQWLADGLIVGTSSSYEVKDSDEGKRIRLQVSYIDNNGFNEVALSAATLPALPTQIPPIVLPPNTPFKFRTVNDYYTKELSVSLYITNATSVWALYDNNGLVADNTGFVVDGIWLEADSIYNSVSIKIVNRGEPGNNSNGYRYEGGGAKIKLSYESAGSELNKQVPDGSVFVDSFSSSVSKYEFLLRDIDLSVPDQLPSHITTASSMFAGTNMFNYDISNWNMVNVTSIEQMLKDCKLFNQPIGKWNVNNVRYMTGTFESAKAFNQDLSLWCVAAFIYHDNFDANTDAWTLPKPVWGTCPRNETLYSGNGTGIG